MSKSLLYYRFILLSSILLIGAISHAQRVEIFNANFSDDVGDNAGWYQQSSYISGGYIVNKTNAWMRGADAAYPGAEGSFYHLRRDYNSNRTYRSYMSSYLYSPIINLTGKDKLSMSFEWWLDTYPGTGAEGFKIEYSIDGGTTWRVLGDHTDELAVNWYPSLANGVLDGYDEFGDPIEEGGWTTDTGAWVFSSIDLPAQAFNDNSQTQFRFYFESDGYLSNIAKGLAIDNFKIIGDDIKVKNYSDCGLGIGQNLELWLNGRTLASYSDGDKVDQWTNISSLDPAANISSEWTSATSKGAERPTYYDNPTDNVNFNPVVSFDGTNAMYGKSGFYSQDIYMVINPALGITASRPTEDVFHGDDYETDIGSQDVTGISINNTSARYGALPDIAAYNQGAQTSYGKAIIHPTLSYTRPVLFNARVKADGSGMDLYLDGIDLGVTLSASLSDEQNIETFKDILDSRYWLGRSEFWGTSFTGDIMEVMSFSERKSDADRARLESYLAVKFGITLGLFPVDEIALPHVPGAYFDSAGNALWNGALHPGFTYNVTGIGRDDCSLLHQKQAKSVDPNTFITVGLGDIAATNAQNTNAFQSDGDFLMWGSTPSTLVALPTPLVVNLGPSVVTTFTDVTERTWKFKEISLVGNDIPEVKLSVETSGLTSLPVITGNDAYVMIVADDAAFITNVETIFLKTVGDRQECNYDFDGEKYVKFGVAHEVITPRHVNFDGTNDYVAMDDELDMTGDFSISAWVYTTGSNSSNNSKTIVSKRAGVNEGYHFLIRDSNELQVNFRDGVSIRSNTRINNNAWTYVAFVYEGGEGRLYIDGILDTSKSMAAMVDNDNKFCIGARYISKNNLNNYFKGRLEEIRMFDTAITVDQLRFMMNQEILKDGTGIKGTIIPTSVTKNDLSGLQETNLAAYFNMNTYIGTHLNDASGNGHRGSLKSPENFEIQVQSAPLPYIAIGDGQWDDPSNWMNGTEGYFPGFTRVINGRTEKIDWNIVRTAQDISLTNEDVTLLGLEVLGGELSVKNDHGLTVTHHLILNGTIDLEGESQLVQTTNSDLIATALGKIERDQQGTSDGFNYNFWSSPVSKSSTGANSGFSLEDVLRDGTDVNNIKPLNYTNSSVNNGAPATATSAATISGRWLYKYSNFASGTYSNWLYMPPSMDNLTGEGWTMKGTFASGGEQNYTFVGTPNNGDITLPISNGSDYLIGNPYPSAIDAHQFLQDNPDLDGTVYFWEHWGGNSHTLKEYQGGYSTYNLSGGVGNATLGTSHPLVNSGGVAVKVPKRYIPVAQGFFVTGTSDGTITFNNSQRQFETEGSGNSIFTAAPGSGQVTASEYHDTSDSRAKIRLGFNSPNKIHRQLLLTVDSSATAGYDRGYDGLMYGEQYDDMSWVVENEKYVIQGIDDLKDDTVLPLQIKLRDAGPISIVIDELSNFPVDQDIYIYDNKTGVYSNLRDEEFTVDYLYGGKHTDRFFLVFEEQSTLSNDDVDDLTVGLQVYKPASQSHIVVKNNTGLGINQVRLTNMLGQQVAQWEADNQQLQQQFNYSGLSTGNYIVSVVMQDDSVSSHKIRIE
ncbi:LamG-like jellyroll fold domain-containing protein [Nonlabens ponticola]|uniref:T9SS type A sorting domain-containing protein n=1 Tax=Nonlabens ponticola TaxID=2496866 RepID=A0A3S9MYU9_9FLAO|nr:LamG-like jellyroll fold domain-containing protein [Nonlabens ponticola]AZQ44272.1 T9SS type A sorting domain-containing protein [Nonlabens ponticola]